MPDNHVQPKRILGSLLLLLALLFVGMVVLLGEPAEATSSPQRPARPQPPTELKGAKKVVPLPPKGFHVGEEEPAVVERKPAPKIVEKEEQQGVVEDYEDSAVNYG